MSATPEQESFPDLSELLHRVEETELEALTSVEQRPSDEFRSELRSSLSENGAAPPSAVFGVDGSNGKASPAKDPLSDFSMWVAKESSRMTPVNETNSGTPSRHHNLTTPTPTNQGATMTVVGGPQMSSPSYHSQTASPFAHIMQMATPPPTTTAAGRPDRFTVTGGFASLDRFDSLQKAEQIGKPLALRRDSTGNASPGMMHFTSSIANTVTGVTTPNAPSSGTPTTQIVNVGGPSSRNETPATQRRHQPSPNGYGITQQSGLWTSSTPISNGGGTPHSVGNPTPVTHHQQQQPQQQQQQPFLSITFDSLIGRLAEAARDQAGCRCLQQVLDKPFDSPDVQLLLHEIFPHIASLMSDQYGNFLIQKLLEVAPDPTRLAITSSIANRLASVATTQHGTFAVQKLIESFRSAEEQQVATQGLAHDAILLMTDPYGGHVVQKVLACLPSSERHFLYEGIANHVVSICNDKQGCCVAQRCIENAVLEQQNIVLDAVIDHFLELVLDPYGNYVLQFLMERVPGAATKFVVQFLSTMEQYGDQLLVSIATSKFGSNVMETTLRRCEPDASALLVQRLCRLETLQALVMNGYGNYVIQTALAQAPAKALPHLISALMPILPSIRQQPYGRKFEGKLEAATKRAASGAPPVSTSSPMSAPSSPPQHRHTGSPHHQHHNFLSGGGPSPSQRRQPHHRNHGSAQNTPQHQQYHQRSVRTPPMTEAHIYHADPSPSPFRNGQPLDSKPTPQQLSPIPVKRVFTSSPTARHGGDGNNGVFQPTTRRPTPPQVI